MISCSQIYDSLVTTLQTLIGCRCVVTLAYWALVHRSWNHQGWELEEKWFKVKLTVIDTHRFGNYVNNCNSCQSLTSLMTNMRHTYASLSTMKIMTIFQQVALSTYLYAHTWPHLNDEGIALRELQAATDRDEGVALRELQAATDGDKEVWGAHSHQHLWVRR